MKTCRFCLLLLAMVSVPVGSHEARADQIVCVADGQGNDVCDVTLPNVLAPQTEYPMVQFLPGDTVVSLNASGCVQTGGSGKTWKNYLNPSGANSDLLYHGRISIPGTTNGLVRLSDVVGDPPKLPPSTGGPLILGYEDDGYSDNGYWSHDNGTDDQCADTSGPTMGRASIHLVIHRAATTAPSVLAGAVSGMCDELDDTHTYCRVDRPDVTQATEVFPSIRFLPGDTVTILAEGCVQTGGSGKTWKDYVHPSGPNSDRFYHGLISIPGTTTGLVRLDSVVGKTGLPPSTGGTLTLGYEDDGLSDNGYWNPDDGTENQCAGKGQASVALSITHPAHVNVDAIEVTQAIQDLGESVPLVAGKTTWLRVYLSSTTLPSNTDVDAVANAVVGTAPPVVLGSSATVTLVQGTSLRDRREVWTGSLNFLVPATLTTAGTVAFNVTSVVLASTSAPVLCPLCNSARIATFTNEPTLKVEIFGLSYPTTAGTTAAPSAVDFGLLQSWLGRAYPTASVDTIVTTIPANAKFPFTCNVSNAQLSAIRAMDVANGQDRRRHYFALIANTDGYVRGCASGVPSTPDPSTVASAPTGNPAGPAPVPVNVTGDTDASFGDWYGGHEIAHTFGRAHPGFCNGNSKDDLSFPYPNGQISDDLGTDTGLDVGDQASGIALTVLPGASRYDIMTYCNQPQWLSAYTYQGVLTRIGAENTLFPSGGPGTGSGGGAEQLLQGEFVHVVASLDLTSNTGKFRYVFPVSVAEPQRQRGDSAEVIVLSAQGKVLGKYAVAVRIDTDIPRGEHQTALVDASVPLNRGAARLQLLLAGKVVDEFKASSRPPLPPTGLHIEGSAEPDSKNEKATTTIATLRWTPSKANGEQVTYIVMRTDDKEHWETIGIGITDASLALTPQQARSLRLRVIATNGFVLSDSATVTGMGR